VEVGDVHVVRELLPNVQPELVSFIGPEGDTLLHLACLYGHAECARVLMDCGASVSVRDEDDSTVLHDAAAGGCAPRT
jgi:ankyrin repeat protein